MRELAILTPGRKLGEKTIAKFQILAVAIFYFRRTPFVKQKRQKATVILW